MKKQLLTLTIAVTTCYYSYAQTNTFPSSGNVGIGTTSPGRLLDIVSGTSVGPIKVSGPNGFLLIDNVGSGESYYQANSFHQFQGTSGNPILTMLAGGNVGIGTITPDVLLAVAGTIHTKEVKVDLIGWPDYVFRSAYQLPSLAAVRTYIDQNHHLPEMPSEQDVAKDGVNLGEIVKLQTKKIEELTLYLLEKDKQDKQKQAQIDQLKQQVETLIKEVRKSQ